MFQLSGVICIKDIKLLPIVSIFRIVVVLIS
jgi:hypothetical protein